MSSILTIGFFHTQIRDRVFLKCSPKMNTFAEKNLDLMNSPITPQNINILVKTEDTYAKTIKSTNCFGDFLAKYVSYFGIGDCSLRFFAAHYAAYHLTQDSSLPNFNKYSWEIDAYEAQVHEELMYSTSSLS